MIHELTADTEPLKKKPSHDEVGAIKHRMTRVTIGSVREFIEDIGQGVSWSGGVFKNDHLMNKNFISSSIIGIDIDENLKPQEAIDKFTNYGITPSCWYPSWNDDPQGKRKFRLVFFLDRKITDKNAHRALMNLFIKLIPELDKSATDCSRFFYGSNDPGVVLNPKEISFDDLYTALSTHAVSGANLQQNGRKSKGGKALQQHTLRGSSFIETNTKTSESTILKEHYDRLKNNLHNKQVDWDKLASRVKVVDQFLNGDERLKYSQLVGIATNLAWMKSGSEIYKNRLQEFNDNYEGNDLDGIYRKDGRWELVRDFQQRNRSFQTCMFPMNLENEKFMAPVEDHKYKNLIHAERDQQVGVKIVEPVERMRLPKAEQLFAYKFSEVMQSWDTDIHIFKVHTALGKTNAILNANSNTLCSFNTHDLKDEVAERRGDKHNFVVTPRLPHFRSQKLNRKIAKLYALGFNGRVHRLLVNVYEGRDMDEQYCLQDKVAAKEYITKKKEIYATNRCILTTHDWAIHAINKLPQIDCLVTDEDPISTLAPIDNVKISDLTKMANKSGETLFPWKGDHNMLDIVNFLIKEVDDGEITKLPSRFELDLSERATAYSQIEGLSSNVKDFLESDYIYKEGDTIHYINQSFLPDDRKVVILSASVHENFYKEIYGSRVKVHDISDIHQEGEIEQHMKKSYSRISLKNSLQEAKDLQDGSPVITFMTMKDEFEDADQQCHFGNTSGYDHLKNKDTKIIGTPYPHSSKVFLFGKILGIPVAHPRNREFGRKNVTFNGLEFNFSTFTSNERLSNIQLELVHADLLQAAGRSRTLRCDCTCKVYSNFPLRIATSYHY